MSRTVVKDLLPTLPDSQCERIQHLWTELINLNGLFSKRPENVVEGDIEQFESRSKEWVRRFLEIYHSGFITPYIHAMACHVGEFMRLHGSILPFTQQGLEKLNDTVTKMFFRGTNHQGEKALQQILEKHNRIEFLRDSDMVPRQHHEVKCSLCGQVGHNKLTCKSLS